VIAAVGCGGPDLGQNDSGRTTFSDWFQVTEHVTLEEDPSDLIGTIELFIEMADGDFVVTDGTRPVARRFGPGGELRARHGIYGSGPFEFRRIRGAVEDREGRLVLIDPQLARLTRFVPPLNPDTILNPGVRPLGFAQRLSAGFFLLVVPESRSVRGLFLTDLEQPLTEHTSISVPIPDDLYSNPYWGSYARTVITTADTLVLAANSFRYPIYMYDARGGLVDSLGTPPPTYRPPRVLPAGALAGTDAPVRRAEWMASFDVIADMHVLHDSLLVVVHGSLRPGDGAAGTPVDHSRIDLYNLRSSERLASDLQLPDAGNVLGSSTEELFVLGSGPPAPWSFHRVRVRLAEDASAPGTTPEEPPT
jgi:hypothetical protein